MDRLTLMRSFVGVTKSRSFSQAARTLGISGSLVSRHVAELERDLDVRLVNRTARTVSLTDAGTRYAEFAARIIEEIDREEESLRGLRDKPEGTLSIISPKWIGSNDVGDAIVAFSTRYPKIRIRFEVGGMSERAYDFLDQGFDVAFHTRHVRDSNLLLRKIADLNFMLCASPTYLHRAGRPTQVTELTEHDCLMNTNDPIWQRSGLLVQQLPHAPQGGPGRPRGRPAAGPADLGRARGRQPGRGGPRLRGAGPAALCAARPRRPDAGPGPAVPRLRHRLVPPPGRGRAARPGQVGVSGVRETVPRTDTTCNKRLRHLTARPTYASSEPSTC
jgi:DNA-binding transcriptional LysR family regulator